MFSTFFRFETWFWLKSYMLWIFLAVLTGLLMAVLLSEEAVIEDVLFGNAYRNSPFVIQRLYGMTAVFGCLMVTAFVNSAAIRDFAYDTHQLVFTKPISKLSYLSGRFFGATIISFIPMLGASLAVFLSPALSPGDHWGPTYWSAHFWSILIFAIPNTFFISAVVFSIAVWTRSTLASFLGILGLMVALSVSGALIGTLANESLAALSDPFGDTALANMTKYWTTSDRNTQVLPLTGLLLWNRLIWVGVGFLFLASAYYKFSFTTQPGLIQKFFNLIRSSVDEIVSTPFHTTTLPAVHQRFGKRSQMQQVARMTQTELWTTIKSPMYICMLFGVVLSVAAGLSVQTTLMFGVSSLPVTFILVDLVRESLIQFQWVLITFYAGVFVWKERDANLDEVLDALPTKSWLPFFSKLITLVIVVASTVFVGILCGLCYQFFSGFFHFQIGLYFQELLIIDMVQLGCLMVLALFCHVISPNKYVGYFLFIALLVTNLFLWPITGIESKLWQYGTLPTYTYSDMFARKPYGTALGWYAVYWWLFASLLAIATILFWPRGKQATWSTRLASTRPRWTGTLRLSSIVVLLLWVCTGAWIYWNTEVVNAYDTAWEQTQKQVRYEKEYKSLQSQPQPRVTNIRYEIDLYPRRRAVIMNGVQTIVNQDSTPIEKIYLWTYPDFETTVDIEGANLTENGDELGMLTYSVDPPMKPGEKRQMTFNVEYSPEGFENSVRVQEVVQNGTFFNNLIAPQIGYQSFVEIPDPDQRKRNQLDEATVNPLEPENLEVRRNNYLSNNSDWVNVETIISTSEDQIAVAPGSLQRKWTENGRRYFHYKLDHPSLNFYAFVSAQFEVAVRQWNGIDIEIYHHPSHHWNVDLMLRSVRKSLEYYTEAFGPYKHKQARIVEYPRVAYFAQAFPGTMPYSEGVGFIMDHQSEDDIDMVYYVVAHEIAHQWWAHQVIGANMEGATLLSETLSQYSALMVMEREYGRDMMRKFLAYEMDNYLRGRSRDNRSEYPLLQVGTKQGYIHYNKGSVVMYHLKETIGEDKVNAALRSIVDRFAYADAPYPTSVDLVEALKKQTPPEHQSLLSDLFEHITLFQNVTKSATYRKIEEKQFEVTIEVDFKKLRSDAYGKETDVQLDDWIEIGAFAQPKGGSKFGETLHRQKVHVTSNTQTFTFVVNQLPYSVGVDPFSLIIDRNKSDNMKKPEKIE